MEESNWQARSGLVSAVALVAALVAAESDETDCRGFLEETSLGYSKRNKSATLFSACLFFDPGSGLIFKPFP